MMSTFITNLNDTIVLSDSTLVELAKIVSTCQPCVQEAQTSCQDVELIKWICITLVMVAIVFSVAMLIWQWRSIKADELRMNKEFTNEVTRRENDFKHDIERKREELYLYIKKDQYERSKKNDGQKTAASNDNKGM